jgi:hypothetical protein
LRETPEGNLTTLLSSITLRVSERTYGQGHGDESPVSSRLTICLALKRQVHPDHVNVGAPVAVGGRLEPATAENKSMRLAGGKDRGLSLRTSARYGWMEAWSSSGLKAKK